MLKQITPEGRRYIKDNYRIQGALHCAHHTGLTINQIWGLAYRLGLTSGQKKGQPHATHREHYGAKRPSPHLMEYRALQDAINHFTATQPTLEERLEAITSPI